jgi:hypothetical protein
MPRIDPEIEAQFVELLAEIYRRIDWRKIRVRSPHDVWNHRVRAAARRPTLGQFVSKLSNFFGLQSCSDRALQLQDVLRPYERELLNLAFREHIPIAMRAALMAANRKSVSEAQMGLELMSQEVKHGTEPGRAD